jgi:hypothetical protein
MSGPQLIGAENFKRIKEDPPADSVTWMYYGPAKTGKTFFSASAAPRALFINNGAGMETLKSPLCRQLYPTVDEMLFVTIEDQFDDKGNHLYSAAFDMMGNAIHYALVNLKDQFDTIIVDDSTSARRHAMMKGLELNQATDKSKTLKNIVEKYDVVSPAVQDYGIEMQIILQFLDWSIKECKKAKKHLLVGAHERMTLSKPDQIGGQPTVMRIRPGFTGQTMPDDIGGMWDMLTHTEAVGGGLQTIYRHRFNGDEITQAGVRYGGIFETVESNVNFLKCVERIKAQQVNPKAIRR